MSSEIKPADVYDKVEHLYAVVIWLARLMLLVCGLIIMQIFAKAIIYTRIARLLSRVEILLTLTERHGAINDQKTQEIKAQAVQVAQAATATVKAVGEEIKAEMPAAVVAAIKRDSSDGGDSVIIVTPPTKTT